MIKGELFSRMSFVSDDCLVLINFQDNVAYIMDALYSIDKDGYGRITIYSKTKEETNDTN